MNLPNSFVVSIVSVSLLLSVCLNSPMILGAKSIKDRNLQAQLIIGGLNRPTSMTFLGQDDILVAEKQGMVQRIVGKNISNIPVLNLTSIVNSTGERGVLGIASSHVWQNNTDKHDNDSNIYLIFTANVNNTDVNNAGNVSCNVKKCDSTNSVVLSLYHYNYKNGQLVNPTPLVYVPLASNDSIQHIGGAITVGPDNKIYFTTGDGRGCEYFENCSSKVANITDSNGLIGKGGIFSTDEDARRDNYNGKTTNNYYQYAYGIRNSFGLDFDPVTGNLWDTENGPAFGDEINLVKPGFNSGYAKVQGIWPITNYSELFNNPPPGFPKGYYFKNGAQGEINFEKIKNFNGKGKYSSPEFTWNRTVGVTAIKFFNSDKLGKKYENDLFVGDAFGSIYHFDLNQNRTGLNLNDSLSDKVANNDDELHDVLFAQGLAPRGITDMEVGPDGYLYVLLYGANGSIYKIIPK